MRAAVYAAGVKRSLSLVAENAEEAERVAGLRPYSAAFAPERGGFVVRRDPERGSQARFRPNGRGGEVMLGLEGPVRPPLFGRRNVTWKPLESGEGIVVSIEDPEGGAVAAADEPV